MTGRTKRDKPFFEVNAGTPVMHDSVRSSTPLAAFTIPSQHAFADAGEMARIVIGGIVTTPAQTACADLVAAARPAEQNPLWGPMRHETLGEARGGGHLDK